MEQKYIEGDLVMIKTEPNNCTPNEVVYKFVVYVAIDNVLLKTINGIYRLVGKDLIVPIPLTPSILEKNGWDFTGYNMDFNGNLLNICSKRDILPYLYYYYATESFSVSISRKIVLPNIKYVHELQHLLFGLGLNSEMEV